MDETERLKRENEELKKEVERLKSLRINQKKGMIKKASQGNLMARPAFGYKLSNSSICFFTIDKCDSLTLIFNFPLIAVSSSIFVHPKRTIQNIKNKISLFLNIFLVVVIMSSRYLNLVITKR